MQAMKNAPANASANVKMVGTWYSYTMMDECSSLSQVKNMARCSI